MGLSEIEREQHLSDMKSLIADNRKQKKRFPRDIEFAELCGISIRSVKNYRKIISQRNTKVLVDRFEIEKIQSVEDTLDTLYKHIEWYEKIMDGDKDVDSNIDLETRMSAAKLIEEARKNITEVILDSPIIFYDPKKNNNKIDNDNVLFNKEHLHRTKEKITQGLKSITD